MDKWAVFTISEGVTGVVLAAIGYATGGPLWFAAYGVAGVVCGAAFAALVLYVASEIKK